MFAIKITKQTRALAEVIAGHPIPQRFKDQFLARAEDGTTRFMTTDEFTAFAEVNDLAPMDFALWQK